MADLTVSYDYLDGLAGTLTTAAGQVRRETSSADHDVSGSSSVGASGNELADYQASLAQIVSENIDVLAASVAGAAAALAEADNKLSDSTSRRRGGGGSF